MGLDLKQDEYPNTKIMGKREKLKQKGN